MVVVDFSGENDESCPRARKTVDFILERRRNEDSSHAQISLVLSSYAHPRRKDIILSRVQGLLGYQFGH